MKPSPAAKVQELYEESAESYAEMMDAEIDQPIYADTLGRLAARIVHVSGVVIDTSCGSGHVLDRYRQVFDPDRALVGIDLSPRMVEIATSRLGACANVMTGDMRDLSTVGSGSAAAVLSFFAIHHLAPEGVVTAIREWRRILTQGGQLVIAAWEGAGPIDYGGASDVVALRYSRRQVADWVDENGFVVDRSVVEPVEDMPMEAVYLEATNGSVAELTP